MSVKTEMLRMTVHVNSYIEFRLPTDEVLQVAVLNY